MKQAGHDGPPGDLITGYLAQLRAGLRLPRHKADLIVAEAEDHLRETVAAGMAAGMTELEAQEAALSSFGPIRAVARAHQARYRRIAVILGQLAFEVWNLVALLILAVGAGGLALAVVFELAPARIVRQSGDGSLTTTYTGAHWIHFGLPAGLGVLLLAGYWLTRREVPAGFFPAVAVSVVSSIGLAVIACTWDRTPLFGTILIVVPLLAVTAGYSTRMGQALLRRR